MAGKSWVAKSRYSWLLCWIVVTFLISIAHAKQLKMMLRDRQDISVVMNIQPGLCPASVPVTIVSSQESDFRDESKILGKVMAWAQITVSTTCPDATTIRLAGIVNEQTVYQGIAQRANDWALTEASPEESISPTHVTKSPASATVLPCDSMAAYPEDPEAVATGIDDEQLDAQAVITACREAVQLDDKTPRLRFQLARGYLKADRFEEAIEQILIAAGEGHGGALAYLADLTIEGAPGIAPDLIVARMLYQKAVESGFTPAAAVLAQFEDKTDVYYQAEKEEKEYVVKQFGFSKGKYFYPEIIVAIFMEDFDSVPYSERFAKLYLANIAENISEICEAHFEKAEIRDLKMTASLHGEDFSKDATTLLLTDMIIQLGTIMKNPTDTVLQSAKNEADWNEMPEEAMKDTGALLSGLQCDSEELEVFSKNARAFITSDGAPEVKKEGLMRSCKKVESASQKDGFCMCFIGALRRASVLRGHRRLLETDFLEGARQIMRNNSDVFGLCGGI